MIIFSTNALNIFKTHPEFPEYIDGVPMEGAPMEGGYPMKPHGPGIIIGGMP